MEPYFIESYMKANAKVTLLRQSSADFFSAKGHTVNILDLVSNEGSPATSQFCHFIWKQSHTKHNNKSIYENRWWVDLPRQQ